MSGSVDFSQMARSWALVPRPGAAAAARRHPATCRLLQPTPDPNTLEVRCGLAGWLAGLARCLAGGQGRPGQGRPGTYPRTRVLEVFGSRALWWPGLARLAVWSGFLHLFPRLAATHTPRPSPNPWVRGVCQSCVLICSHLPRWFFSSRPPIQGAASTFHSSLLSSQSREPAAHNPHLPHPASALFNCVPSTPARTPLAPFQ